MPQLGEIRKSGDIGFKGKNKSQKYIWAACEVCGKERWVELVRGEPTDKTCGCNYTHSEETRKKLSKGRWAGGKSKSSHGYVTVNLRSDSPFLPMAIRNHIVYEHRLVMAEHLGRCLDKSEIVHHKNGKRDDNRLENLEIYQGIDNHSAMHSKGYQDGFKKGYLDGKSKRIKELEFYIQKLEAIISGNRIS